MMLWRRRGGGTNKVLVNIAAALSPGVHRRADRIGSTAIWPKRFFVRHRSSSLSRLIDDLVTGNHCSFPALKALLPEALNATSGVVLPSLVLIEHRRSGFPLSLAHISTLLSHLDTHVSAGSAKKSDANIAAAALAWYEYDYSKAGNLLEELLLSRTAEGSSLLLPRHPPINLLTTAFLIYL